MDKTDKLEAWDREPEPCWSCGGDAEARDDIHVRCIDSKGINCEVMGHWFTRKTWNTRSRASVAASPPEHGISWAALLGVLERLRSKNRNPANEWYHGWNAAIQCLINDINARSASPVAATVDAETARIAHRRLEIALGYIKRAANRELPKLPCHVQEMTEREVAIFNVGAAAVGNLQFIARELDALDVPAALADSSIRAAAAEIVEMFKGWMSLEQRIDKIAAILSKRLGSAAVGQQELERLKKWQDDVVEREAAVCPEDVPFDEYIRHLERKLKESTPPMPNRPWCCPEPKCTPVYQVKDSDYEDITAPVTGESFFCFGMMDRPVAFSYDGAAHNNDLNSCTYTALKGVIRFQENEADWEALEIGYRRARQKVKDIRAATPTSPEDGK